MPSTVTTRSRRNAQTGPRLLSYDQVAERLGTGRRFAERLVRERRIDFVRVGRHVRIDEAVLDAWIAANTVEASE